MFDTSKEIRPDELSAIKDYLLKLVNMYNISESNTRISLVTYGGKSQVLLPLREGITSSAIKIALNNIKGTKDDRRLDLALNTLRTNVLRDARETVGKLAVLFIMGPSSRSVYASIASEAKALKDKGIKFSVVAVGDDVSAEELQAVTSEADDVVKLNTVSNLDQVTPALTKTSGSVAGKF